MTAQEGLGIIIRVQVVVVDWGFPEHDVAFLFSALS
jgi:hypothetical protein